MDYSMAEMLLMFMMGAIAGWTLNDLINFVYRKIKSKNKDA